MQLSPTKAACAQRATDGTANAEEPSSGKRKQCEAAQPTHILGFAAAAPRPAAPRESVTRSGAQLKKGARGAPGPRACARGRDQALNHRINSSSPHSREPPSPGRRTALWLPRSCSDVLGREHGLGDVGTFRLDWGPAQALHNHSDSETRLGCGIRCGAALHQPPATPTRAPRAGCRGAPTAWTGTR